MCSQILGTKKMAPFMWTCKQTAFRPDVQGSWLWSSHKVFSLEKACTRSLQEATESPHNDVSPHTNSHMNAHCTIIDNSQKGEGTQILLNQWMDRSNIVYPYKPSYPTLNTNEVPIHPTAGMNMILSEISQSQKGTWLHLYQNGQNRQIRRLRK